VLQAAHPGDPWRADGRRVDMVRRRLPRYQGLLSQFRGGIRGLLPDGGPWRRRRLRAGRPAVEHGPEVAFAFRISGTSLVVGMGLAVVMGVAGGVLPAFRAARMPNTSALG